MTSHYTNIKCGMRPEIVDRWSIRILCGRPHKSKRPVWPRPLADLHTPSCLWSFMPNRERTYPEQYMLCHRHGKMCAIFRVINKVMAKLTWKLRSMSKVIVHNTCYYASDHWCKIWKEYIQNCACCRADTTRRNKTFREQQHPWLAKIRKSEY